MKTKRIIVAVLTAAMVIGVSLQPISANTLTTEGYPKDAIIIQRDAPTMLTNEQILELIALAPDTTETRSRTTLADRRITESELLAWIEEYWELGGVNAFELEVVKLINIERENHNLNPLAINPNLVLAARFHSQQMTDLRFFSHRSPHHGRGIYRATMFGHENIQEHVWGVQENIGGGGRTPQELVQSWMNSPAHRAAILGESFLTVGVGTIHTTTAKFGA